MKKKNSTSGLSPFCQFIEIGFFLMNEIVKKRSNEQMKKKIKSREPKSKFKKLNETNDMKMNIKKKQ